MAALRSQAGVAEARKGRGLAWRHRSRSWEDCPELSSPLLPPRGGSGLGSPHDFSVEETGQNGNRRPALCEPLSYTAAGSSPECSSFPVEERLQSCRRPLPFAARKLPQGAKVTAVASGVRKRWFTSQGAPSAPRAGPLGKGLCLPDGVGSRLHLSSDRCRVHRKASRAATWGRRQ